LRTLWVGFTNFAKVAITSALAVKQNGTLATFDRTIPLKAVAAAERRHLTVLGRA
jgi:hypothetical protein